ncbi:hypothetical protein B0H13DRAFT_2292635 [Mycena leptocephala]|nr:hypothetical protein B0H13DRAFT_2292635 [Mycena leptocephala]
MLKSLPAVIDLGSHFIHVKLHVERAALCDADCEHQQVLQDKASQLCQCYRRVPRREEQECRAGGLFRMLYRVFLVTLSIFLTIIMAPNSGGNWLSRRWRMLERLMFQPVFEGVGTPPLPQNRYVLVQQVRREQERQAVSAAPQAAPQAPRAPPTRCEAAQRVWREHEQH